MLTLTLNTSNDGYISYKAEHAHLKTIGEFLINDALQMPDFIRALLSSNDEEFIELDSCSIQTKKEDIIITHRTEKKFPIVSLPKERMLQILTVWEDFLIQKNSTQWIFFKQEEFDLSDKTDNISGQWENREKTISHI